MENEVYGRLASIVIGRPQRMKDVRVFPKIAPFSIFDDSNSTTSCTVYSPNISDFSNVSITERAIIPPKWVEWTDLQFTAEIGSSKKGRSDTAATATINLYNLNDQDRDFIEKGYTLILRAGYQQDIGSTTNQEDIVANYESQSLSDGARTLPLLFIGDIIDVRTEKDGEDQVTTILCKDSAYSLRNLRVSQSYGRNITYREVIEDLIGKASTYGVNLGQIYLVNSILDPNSAGTTSTTPTLISPSGQNFGPNFNRLDEAMPSGYVAYGGLLQELQKVCSSIGYRAYLCLGKLYVEPEKLPATKPVISLDNDESLYYIRPSSDGSYENEGSTSVIKEIELSMPLDARYNLAVGIRIDEGKYKGSWDIESVVFKMDFEGNDWDTVIKAVSK